MRSAEELEAELVRTRRRLYRVSGVMTFVFIACLVVVFAAVGGALVVVDRRAAQTLPSDANDTHQATNQAATAPTAPPVARTTAAPPATVAAAPAQPQPPPVTVAEAPANPAPPTRVAAAPAAPPPTPPQAQMQASPPTAGAAPGAAIRTAQPVAIPLPPPKAAPPASTDARRTARVHPRQDERTTVGAAPSDTALRSDDPREHRRARVRPGDEDVADAPRAERVIVVDQPPRYRPQPDQRADDQAEPPRQHDLFGDLFGGIFGHHDQ